MNKELFPEIKKPIGETVKGWCKCGQECDCVIQIYSNGTRHAIATCPKCGLRNAKAQKVSISLEDLKHRLMGVYSAIDAIPDGLERDEAISMVERLGNDLQKLYSK